MIQPWKKVICHVDMDAFFAAIEQLKNPELRGQPVIIGADPRKGRGRGVVSTASYEARVFGVHSAMPISKAYKLCPHGIFVKPEGQLYSQYSRQIMNILDEFTPLVQPVSIDEAFMDVSGSVHLFGSVEKIGEAIRRRIFEETGLTASVGIAPSKSVAKIASDYQKPDGMTIVPQENVQKFLDSLPVTKLWGVGKKTFANLEKLGITTVRQLREYPLDLLTKKYGKMGPHLHRMSRGIDEREVHDRDPVKSISHETTFREDHTDLELISATLLSLSENVSVRLRKKTFRGKTIQLKIRYEDFSTFTRHKTLSHPTNLTEEIFRISKSLFDEFYKGRPVRLIGVGVSQLIDENKMQTSLLDVENERKMTLEKVMDKLQEKFGKSGLTHADTLSARKKRKSSSK